MGLLHLYYKTGEFIKGGWKIWNLRTWSSVNVTCYAIGYHPNFCNEGSHQGREISNLEELDALLQEDGKNQMDYALNDIWERLEKLDKDHKKRISEIKGILRKYSKNLPE